MKKPSEFKVGDCFYFAYRDQRDQHRNEEVKIVKIGRRWCELNNGMRFDMTDDDRWWMIDGRGYSSPGNIYPSKQYHEDQVESARLIQLIRHQLVSYLPISIPIEDIQSAVKLLRIKEDD